MDLLINPILDLFNEHLEVFPLTNEPGNEMIRVGGGLNKHRGFFRIDLWSKGFRVTKR